MNGRKKLLYVIFLCSFIYQATVCSNQSDLNRHTQYKYESTLDSLSRRFVAGEAGVGMRGYRLFGEGPALRGPVFFVVVSEQQRKDLLIQKQEKEFQKAVEEQRK